MVRLIHVWCKIHKDVCLAAFVFWTPFSYGSSSTVCSDCVSFHPSIFHPPWIVPFQPPWFETFHPTIWIFQWQVELQCPENVNDSIFTSKNILSCSGCILSFTKRHCLSFWFFSAWVFHFLLNLNLALHVQDIPLPKLSQELMMPL